MGALGIAAMVAAGVLAAVGALVFIWKRTRNMAGTRERRQVRVFITGMFAVWAGVIAAYAVWWAIRRGQTAAFSGDVGEYLALAPPAPAAAPSASAYVTGRLLPLNVSEQKVDDVFFDLPADLRVARAGDTGTVAFLYWDRKVTGHYENGDPGYTPTCTVLVYDKARSAVVGGAAFQGGNPPDVKQGSGGDTGRRPEPEIVAYLSRLPRK